jgi:hypothetical protein
MNKKKINLRDIPNTLDIKITEKLVNYSVAFGRIRDKDSRTFQLLGSGTLVQKGGKYGILTAHHCLHAVYPESVLGNINSDILVCVIKGSQTVIVENHEISEIQLAYPENKKYGEYGPDLTFINIPNGPRLSTFKAISSFWNLDINSNDVNKEFVKNGYVLANSGFPEADYEIMITKDSIYEKIKFMSFISVIDKDHIEYVNEWDFINSVCNYANAKEVPQSFAGLSGGGIWAVRLKFNEDMKEWDVHDIALIGMTFYQSLIENKKRFLRGHFIDSIYNRAWNNSKQKAE